MADWRALRGLSEKLAGLKEGDDRLISLAPREAFGDWRPEAVLALEEDRLGGNPALRDGAVLEIRTGSGIRANCTVYRVAPGRLALDFNHSLAGHGLAAFARIRKVLPPRQRSAARRAQQ